jgi:hypothetical protein
MTAIAQDKFFADYAEDIKKFGGLFKTAHAVGLRLVPAHKLAKLLAALYVVGGGNESFVLGNVKVMFHIKEAQYQFKIKGGETPTKEGIDLIKEYTCELESWISESNDGHDPKIFAPDWLYELEKEYKIEIYQLSKTRKEYHNEDEKILT